MSEENNDIIEKVADFMHDQWSHWMKYLYKQLMEGKSYSDLNKKVYAIKSSDYNHWKRQMETPYPKLSEKEKDSDREWAIKLLELLGKTHELRNRNNCTNCDRYAEEDHLCSGMI